MVRRRTISPQLQARDDRGSRTHFHDTSTPTWTEVKAAVERLDNATFTEVSLRIADRTLELAGGRDQRIVCRIVDHEAGGGVRFLIDATLDPALFEQVIGGRATPLTGIASVPRATALKAARHFFDRHAEDPNLTWSAAI